MEETDTSFYWEFQDSPEVLLGKFENTSWCRHQSQNWKKMLPAEHQKPAANCTGVVDFKACLGNTVNFCPTNISCQCKNEKPFCRCDFSRVDWREFWYMDPKCSHLWNTLDLILVTVLPAIALVIIVAAIFYCVYYCKSEKARNQTNPPYCEAQHNPAFTVETAGSLGHVYHQSPKDGWVGRIPKAVLRRPDFDDGPAPSQLENYSGTATDKDPVNGPMHPQPLRRPDPTTDYFSNQRPQYEKSGYPSNNLPYADYAEGRQYRRY
ncbi:uncharacterized protein LOC142603329 isoform X1 [Balearica regulorum gibbericeps]|uniref:uncharacterized protein LOC142603329 isoform X1 n=1 Tax=Balearica regulorum gibbericeps TaxID=100784 RepID=UPI003F633A10